MERFLGGEIIGGRRKSYHSGTKYTLSAHCTVLCLHIWHLDTFLGVAALPMSTVFNAFKLPLACLGKMPNELNYQRRRKYSR